MLYTSSPDFRSVLTGKSLRPTNRRAVMDNARSPSQIPVERQISVGHHLRLLVGYTTSRLLVGIASFALELIKYKYDLSVVTW